MHRPFRANAFTAARGSTVKLLTAIADRLQMTRTGMQENYGVQAFGGV
jgi:hypothetical protein